MNNKTKGVLFLIISAFLYGTMPVLMRLLNAGGITPISQVFLRYIVAFITALIYFFIIKKQKIIIDKKTFPILVFVTVFGYSLMSLFLTYAILYTQIGNALFLFYSYAIITPILGFFILKEKLKKYHFFALILSALSLFLLFQPNSIPTWKIGGFFAIGAALCQSIYVVFRKKLSIKSVEFMMLANTFTGVIVLGILSIIFDYQTFWTGTINIVNLNTWIATTLFGIINFFAWFFLTKGFDLFQTTTGSLILLIENVFGIGFALIFFKETPTLSVFIGGIMILLSAIVIIVKDNK